jgi:CheY-like chemotaxis protein
VCASSFHRPSTDDPLCSSPAFILSDVHLPDIGGEAVLEQLRDDPTTAHIPVVVLSADATRQIEGLLVPLPSTFASFATGVSDPALWGSARGAIPSRRY